MKNMNVKIIISAIIIGLFISSCSKKEGIKLEGINFGNAEYYDSFLFISEKNTPISKNIEFEFNDWAKSQNAFVELQLIDENNNIIGNDVSFINVYFNDSLCENGIVKISSKNNLVANIKLEFSPQANDQFYSGYIVVKDNKIERINNIENIKSESKIFEWNADFDIKTNPLKKGLLWFAFIVIILLFIWFVFLRNIMYKKMRKGTLVINSPYIKNIKIAGGRKLIFTTKAKKQKLLSKIFAGNVIYEVNPIWKSDIVFTPKDKRSLRIKTGIHYSVRPYTNQITRGKSYEIKKNNEIIKISYL